MNFLQFLVAAQIQESIATKWLEVYQDNLHMKFLTSNADFSSLSPYPCACKRQRGVALYKVVILPILARIV